MSLTLLNFTKPVHRVCGPQSLYHRNYVEFERVRLAVLLSNHSCDNNKMAHLLVDFGNYLQDMDMFPLYDGAHYLLTTLTVRYQMHDG